jgi:hypothetical protein
VTFCPCDILMVPIQNVWRQNVQGQNVRRDKTSGGTKRPADKMSGLTKRPADNTSGRKNVRTDKTSGRTKRPDGRKVRRHNIRLKKHPCGQNVRVDKTSGDKMSVWIIFNRALLDNTFTEKSIESEGKIRQYCTYTQFFANR